MIKSINSKLKSTAGATLMMALLFFIMCAVVGSIILAAAASSAGRVGNVDTDENRQRYAMTSAARLIQNELSVKTNTGGSNQNGVTFDQQWYMRSLQVDYVSGASENTGTDEKNPISPEDVLSGEEYLARGETLLALDQLGTETFGEAANPYTPVHKPDENDDTVVNGEELNFVNQWVSSAGLKNIFVTSGLSKNSHALTSMNNLSFSDLSQMRDVMAEAVYRNFWTSDITKENMWGGNTQNIKVAWATSSGYKLSAENILIDSGDENIYPVYANVTMDENLKLTFELYCGSRSDKNGSDGKPVTDTTGSITDPDDSMIRMWVIFEPSGTKLTYKNTVTNKDISLNPLYVEKENTQTVPGNHSGDKTVTTEEDAKYGTVTITTEYSYNGTTDTTTITTTTSWKVERKKHLELQDRSVSFKAGWNKGIITTVKPE